VSVTLGSVPEMMLASLSTSSMYSCTMLAPTVPKRGFASTFAHGAGVA